MTECPMCGNQMVVTQDRGVTTWTCECGLVEQYPEPKVVPLEVWTPAEIDRWFNSPRGGEIRERHQDWRK